MILCRSDKNSVVRVHRNFEIIYCHKEALTNKIIDFKMRETGTVVDVSIIHICSI